MNIIKGVGAAFIILLPTIASAQERPANSQSSAQTEYPASYFTVFTPRSALDMLLRVPGFQLEEAEDRRGLGQGGANVLINGQRLSTKNSNVSEQLTRIVSSNVVKIEILDSNTVKIPGLTGRVANVVTTVSGISGTWEWSARFRNNLDPNFLNGSVSISGEKNDLSYSASLKNETLNRENEGPEDRFLPSGVLFEEAFEKSVRTSTKPTLAAGLVWTPSDDRKALLNIEIGSENLLTKELSDVTSRQDLTDNRAVDFSRSNDNKFGEVTADYTWPLGSGTAKVTGLYNFLDEDITSLQNTQRANMAPTALRFNTLSKSQEAILRSEYEWETGTKQSWQIAIEAAFNSLDLDSDLSTDSGTGIFVNVPSGNNDTLVEESRAEITLSHTWPISPKLIVQSSIGAEYSNLSQSGQVTQSDDFIRPKGFISGTYKASPTLTLSSRLERSVGQLNFADFASSVNLEDNLTQTSNPDLVPAQTWRGEVELNKDFGDGNIFETVLYFEKIEDLVDRIPVGLTGDAVGNIDNAVRYGMQINTTIRGDGFGWRGTELNATLDLNKSEVDDPLTGISRRLNRDLKVRADVSFRHDIEQTDWAYGLGVQTGRNSPTFRATSIQESIFRRAAVTVFIEHKDFYGLKVNASVLNSIANPFTFETISFDGRRDTGNIISREFRNRKVSQELRLTVSGDF